MINQIPPDLPTPHPGESRSLLLLLAGLLIFFFFNHSSWVPSTGVGAWADAVLWRSPTRRAVGGGRTGAASSQLASSQPGLQPWQPDNLMVISYLVHQCHAPQKRSSIDVISYLVHRCHASKFRSSAASLVRPAAAHSPAHAEKRSERFSWICF